MASAPVAAPTPATAPARPGATSGEPSPAADAPLLERALHLFRSERRDLPVEFVRRRIDALAAAAAARMGRAATARERVAALNRFLFEARGFSADPDLEDPDNLYPDRVLRRRRGYCTGLGLVYVAVAARVGLPVRAVATPQHLFLRWESGGEAINIETLEGGRELSDATYRLRYRIPAEAEKAGVFLRSLDDDGFLSQVATNLGALASRDGRLARAADLYEEALRLDPRNVTARFNRARDAMRRGRFAEAAEGFSRALELNPDDALSRNNRGVCRLRLGDRDAAVADFLAALAVDPDLEEARENLEQVAGPPP